MMCSDARTQASIPVLSLQSGYEWPIGQR
jgi:hypothetical protein